MNKTLTGVLLGAAVLAGGCGQHAAHEAHGMGRQAVQPPSPTGGVPSGVPTGPSGLPTGSPGVSTGPSGTAPATPTSPPPGSPGSTSPGAGAGDLRQAARAALAAVPGATLVSIEAEGNGSRWEAHVVGRDGTEHQLDVAGGKVVSGPRREDDDAGDKAERQRLLSATKIGYDQALDKITAAVPGGRVTELNLDTEGGKPVWEADVLTPDGAKRDVTLDAVTGAPVTATPS
ncbi:PepSY domain-containing protein [Nonomuraea sp. NPDC050783]|uniref:PepSY domain-containing protein n=1 Tax=Nonomuraea sp. NPDC050783 TaxID=3154634 RepID=UPI0034679692